MDSNPMELTEEQKKEILSRIQATVGLGGYSSRYMIARMERKRAMYYGEKAQKRRKVRRTLEKAGRRSNRGCLRKKAR